MDTRKRIIERLRENGCRITKQRLKLIDVILENECSSCKEIYYKAVEADEKIGIATVYRMLSALEEVGAINRRNMYKVDCMDEPGNISRRERYRADSEEEESASRECMHKTEHTEEKAIISRGKVYKANCADENEKSSGKKAYVVVLDDNTICRLTPGSWNQVVAEGLKQCGYLEEQKVTAIKIES